MTLPMVFSRGVVSPVLANRALDGMQYLAGPTLGFVRYADDCVP
jgi:hypothetical protein